MGVSAHKIKKWINMLRGDSVYHVNQDEGKCYSKTEVKGYYNNLTEKVSRFGNDDGSVPLSVMDTGYTLEFSIAVFQYGLGAYDLYLMNNEPAMLRKTLSCANWAVEHQQENGGWDTFGFLKPEAPYSAMAQGEGISLLLRAHQATGDERYLTAAKKAMEFMLIPKEQGGVTAYEGDDVYLYEYTYQPLVLNGWVFALWGVYDYYKYTGDTRSEVLLQKTLSSLKRMLPKYDNGYWCKYDMGKRVCSPFYQSLHVAQMKVMYNLFGDEIYQQYAQQWQCYQQSFFKRNRAFLKKAVQKVFERG